MWLLLCANTKRVCVIYTSLSACACLSSSRTRSKNVRANVTLPTEVTVLIHYLMCIKKNSEYEIYMYFILPIKNRFFFPFFYVFRLFANKNTCSTSKINLCVFWWNIFKLHSLIIVKHLIFSHNVYFPSDFYNFQSIFGQYIHEISFVFTYVW